MIAVVDYGMGKVYSVLSALRYLGVAPVLTGDVKQVATAEHIILPGVGSFRKGMEEIRRRGLDKAIYEAVHNHGAKILGICLGMQLLGSRGEEDGDTAGLDLIPNKVGPFSTEELDEGIKVPHVGFDVVRTGDQTGLFSGLSEEAVFYFTHSYRMLMDDLDGRLGVCSYGIDFLAAFEVDNVCGTQFHPEKSQTSGLILFNNFLKK